MTSIGLGAWLNSTFDILCVKHISIITAQFEILKLKLVQITEARINNIPIETEVVKRLDRCLHLYDLLLRYVIEIEKSFSPGIFVQFASSMCVICVTGFQLVAIPLSTSKFVMYVNYLMCMLCQVIMYCWYGHFLIGSSTNIIEACYMSDWLNCSHDIRKSLILMMERAKKPVSMRALNFFTLSLPTLITVLKSSYSYLAVLQHIYSK
ncbi:odorant receptor 94a-like [Aethina tumida]|uniref:odorant receptor 94a-like n=1 Tax=Aethina tumida TaxID=116153 RepID=UPI00214801FF|nr:odorant receptor 94a-like [Aethina tumida]